MQKFEPIKSTDAIKAEDHHNYHHFALEEKDAKRVADMIFADRDKIIAVLTKQGQQLRDKVMKQVLDLKKLDLGRELLQFHHKVDEIMDEVKKLADEAPCELDYLSERLASKDLKNVNEAAYYSYLFGFRIHEVVTRAKEEAERTIADIKSDFDKLLNPDITDDDDSEFMDIPAHKAHQLNREIQRKYHSTFALMNADKGELALIVSLVLGINVSSVLDIKTNQLADGTIAFGIKLKSGVRI